MIKRDIEQLSVCQIEEDMETVPLTYLRKTYLDKTSDTIYITRNNQLYGMVCLDDIVCECQDVEISINKDFISLTGYNVIKAYGFFQRKKKIHKIPVLNEQMELLGDYSRWNDLLYIERYKEELLKADIVKRMLQFYDAIYIIEPVDARTSVYLYLIDRLDYCQIHYMVVGREEIGISPIKENAVYIFLDEDEKLRGQCLWEIDNGVTYGHNETPQIKCFTYKEILLQIMEESELKRLNINTPIDFSFDMLNDKATILLSELQKRGVSCFVFYEDENDYTEFGKKFKEEVNERLKKYPLNLRKPWTKKEENEEFYGELYQLEDYENNIAQEIIYNALNDYQYKGKINNKYVNANGRRMTCFQPDKYIGTIYFLGPCSVIGGHVEDQYTIPSYLQKRLLDAGYLYRVENYGDMVRPDSAIDDKLEEIGLYHEHDIVIYMPYHSRTVNIPGNSIEEIFEEYQIPSVWVKDATYGHSNHKANNLIAGGILERIEKRLENAVTVGKEKNGISINVHAIMTDYVQKKYLERYFSLFSGQEYSTVGAITISGDLFTKGHRYLIEKVREQVEFLIVFVTEEDMGIIPFVDRLQMIEEGTDDIENIMIVPGGSFILSSQTFPQYISKRMDKAVIFNAEYDINTFADYIAGPLHITHRFVGKEEDDKMTVIYNGIMKRILPEKGISFVEIPRMMVGDEYVSSSRSMRYLRNEEYRKAFSFLPISSKRYLMQQL